MVFEDPCSDDDDQIAGVGRQEAEASGAKVVQPDLSTTVSTIPSSPSPSRDVARASQMSPRVERSILRAVQQIREAKQHLKMLGEATGPLEAPPGDPLLAAALGAPPGHSLREDLRHGPYALPVCRSRVPVLFLRPSQPTHGRYPLHQ